MIQGAWEHLKKLAAEQAANGSTPTFDEARETVISALWGSAIAHPPQDAIDYLAKEYLGMIKRGTKPRLSVTKRRKRRPVNV
jgi:hypothetical protein